MTFRRIVLACAVGLLITGVLGVANNVAMRAGYVRLGNALFQIVLWSWPIFGVFFDALFPMEHSQLSPHPWGGYAALIFTVILFSLLTYTGLLITTSRRASS